ncbi:hypothetical protein BRADI_2g15592v3 [Brachypodium distachyon]|uniref:Uncharacterized protein n=1 Tax=Brachypodium distachyon TaxID=15368 RepID=A0A2K2D8R3_BRADI|nr:hypothetical protein BRADI_2g15592v3 [Brachypodium distachyon]
MVSPNTATDGAHIGASFTVSAKTPPNTAPVLAHSSPTWHRHVVTRGGLLRGVRRDTNVHGACLGALFTNSWRGLLHIQQHLHRHLQHQVCSLIHMADGIPASNHLPQHRRGEATPPTCPCTDEVHHQHHTLLLGTDEAKARHYVRSDEADILQAGYQQGEGHFINLSS